MKMKITVGKKKFKFDGEVKKLMKILKVVMSMNQDEQWRTIRYLTARLEDQRTISDVRILKPTQAVEVRR